MTTPRLTVLVTGASGMIGLRLAESLVRGGFRVVGIDARDSSLDSENYTHVTLDLADEDSLASVLDAYSPDRVIHLAALAHSTGAPLTYEDYYRANVLCAERVFTAAAERKIPLLFISTADVYGFVKGVATAYTEPHPVTHYGKTKAQAERRLREIYADREVGYTIFRFQPVYTPEVKRDIQKRYYLKYPTLAYRIGCGAEFEVLAVEEAVHRMTEWLSSAPANDILNVKDAALLNVNDQISAERACGRAKRLLHLPRPIVLCAYYAIKFLTGKNKYTYLLNKAVNPLRTE